MWRREEVLEQLKKKIEESGSLNSYAKSIGCSNASISYAVTGVRALGPKLLDALGLEKHVVTTVVYKKKSRRWK
jgi:hypothetical protein